MAKINLTRAFTLRKRLRTFLNDITTSLSYANVGRLDYKTYPDCKMVKSNEKDFEYNGLNLQEAYELLLKGNEHMITLNNLIDKANVEYARPIINELESEKSKVHLLSLLSQSAKDFVESNTSYESYGLSRDNNMVLVTNNYIRTNDYEEQCIQRM